MLRDKKVNDYYLNPKKCLNCKSVIDFKNKNQNKYCSQKCSSIFTQKNGGHNQWSTEARRRLSDLVKAKYAKRVKPRKYFICKNCDMQFYISSNVKRIYCSHQCKNAYIKAHGLLKGKRGGYREKGGRGKQGWYKGYYCNSSWELAWVMFNLEHGIRFRRNTTGFPYKFNDINYNFYPDFVLEDSNEYIEIKGYLDDKNKSKINSFPFKLNIIDKNKIKMYIDYATTKYGKNFIDLYEK